MLQLTVTAHYFANGHRSAGMHSQLAICPVSLDSKVRDAFVEKVALPRLAITACGQVACVNGVEIIPADRDSAQALAQAFRCGPEKLAFEEFYSRATDGSPVCVFH